MRFLSRPFVDFSFFDYVIYENMSYLKNVTVIIFLTLIHSNELPNRKIKNQKSAKTVFSELPSS